MATLPLCCSVTVLLQAAIEEVKESISEQHYLELYNAAQWCFNLTPNWAVTVIA